MRPKGPSKARFERIFQEGVRATGRAMQIRSLPGEGLVGAAISKKLGDSPTRNRYRRWVREAARAHPTPSLDLVVQVRSATGQTPFAAWTHEYARLVLESVQRWDAESPCF